MFLAVRRWWQAMQAGGASAPRLSVWKWAGLFLFEFLIVLLGVLAAQLIQSEIDLRRSKSKADIAVEQFRTEARVILALATASEEQLPCHARQTQDVMLAALQNRKLDAANYPRPRFLLAPLTPWPTETKNVVRDKYGLGMVQSQSVVTELFLAWRELDQAHLQAWARFGLVDPSLPALSETERGLVVSAATDAKAAIESRSRIVASIQSELARIDIEAPPALLASYKEALPSCPD